MTNKKPTRLADIRRIAALHGAEIDEDSLDACCFILDLPREKVWRCNGEHSITSAWCTHAPAAISGKVEAMADIAEMASMGTESASEESMAQHDYDNGDD